MKNTTTDGIIHTSHNDNDHKNKLNSNKNKIPNQEDTNHNDENGDVPTTLSKKSSSCTTITSTTNIQTKGTNQDPQNDGPVFKSVSLFPSMVSSSASKLQVDLPSFTLATTPVNPSLSSPTSKRSRVGHNDDDDDDGVAGAAGAACFVPTMTTTTTKNPPKKNKHTNTCFPQAQPKFSFHVPIQQIVIQTNNEQEQQEEHQVRKSSMSCHRHDSSSNTTTATTTRNHSPDFFSGKEDGDHSNNNNNNHNHKDIMSRPYPDHVISNVNGATVATVTTPTRSRLGIYMNPHTTRTGGDTNGDCPNLDNKTNNKNHSSQEPKEVVQPQPHPTNQKNDIMDHDDTMEHTFEAHPEDLSQKKDNNNNNIHHDSDKQRDSNIVSLKKNHFIVDGDPTCDNSFMISLSSAALELLGLVAWNDAVRIKLHCKKGQSEPEPHQKQRETVCMAFRDDKACDDTCIRMNRVVRKNLRVELGDIVAVIPHGNVRFAHRIAILPFKDSLEDAMVSDETDLFDEFLKPYFHRTYRPVKKGDHLFIGHSSTSMDTHPRVVEFEVIQMDCAQSCIVSSNTIIHYEGTPLKRHDQENPPASATTTETPPSATESTDNDHDDTYTNDITDNTTEIDWQVENDELLSVALYNYEIFHSLELGSATLKHLEASSAGVAGWASASITVAEGHTAVQTDSSCGSASSAVSTDNVNHLATATASRKGDEEEDMQLRIALLKSIGVKADCKAYLSSTYGNYASQESKDDICSDYDDDVTYENSKHPKNNLKDDANSHDKEQQEDKDEYTYESDYSGEDCDGDSIDHNLLYDSDEDDERGRHKNQSTLESNLGEVNNDNVEDNIITGGSVSNKKEELFVPTSKDKSSNGCSVSSSSESYDMVNDIEKELCFNSTAGRNSTNSASLKHSKVSLRDDEYVHLDSPSKLKTTSIPTEVVTTSDTYTPSTATSIETSTTDRRQQVPKVNRSSWQFNSFVKHVQQTAVSTNATTPVNSSKKIMKGTSDGSPVGTPAFNNNGKNDDSSSGEWSLV